MSDITTEDFLVTAVNLQGVEISELREEISAIGSDLAMLDEKMDRLLNEVYTKEHSDFTPAERLQYAIDCGANSDEVRLYFESLVIANGEHTEQFGEDMAKVRLDEIQELIEVYQEYRKNRISGVLTEGGDGD